MRLNNNVLSKIKKDKEIKRAIEDVTGRSPSRVRAWLTCNDPNLCHYTVLRVISSFTKLEIEDLIILEDSDHSIAVPS